MIPVPSGVRVWLAVGHTDMRRGMNSLAVQVQEVLQLDPHSGALYVFRGKRGHPTSFSIPTAICRGGVPLASAPWSAGSCL
jgi:transposase